MSSKMISETFSANDFTMGPPVPMEALPLLERFYNEVILPVKLKFGTLLATSGNRSVESNAEAHGQPNSHHIYTAEHVALDFFSPNVPSRSIFDWMRNDPTLPYNQLILEAGSMGTSIIHVSMNLAAPGVRSVLTGATHNSAKYLPAEHVDFQSV